MFLEDYLKRNAENLSDKVAVKCGSEQLTYQQLYGAVVERAGQLQEKYGNVSSRIVAFRASQSIDFLVEYFAIHLSHHVAMPLEKGMSDALFFQYQEIAAKASVPNGTADVLFTTGTTGKSKGVLISHRTIIANAENLIERQGFHQDMTFLICGPLNHIGSLSKIYPIILVGGSLVILEGMKDLSAFFRCMDEALGKVATFLVPSSISMLLALGKRQLVQCADKIELIETGAAAITQGCMQQLCAILPHTRLFNTYASTETGIIASFDYNQGECLAGCLGTPMRHSSLEISEEGCVLCGGDTLMSGYLNADELTASVFRNGKILTKDLGELDEKGRLHLLGRDDDIVNVGGFKVNPLEVENVVMSYPAIADCICITFEHPVLGTALKLLYVLKPEADFQLRPFAKFLQKQLEPYKVPQRFELVARIERTYNGKLNRKFYK